MKRGQDSRSLASLSSVSQPSRSTSSASICTLDSAHTSAAGKRVPARVTRQQSARQRELEVCLLQSSQSPLSDDESDDELETFEPDDADEPAALSSRDLASSLDAGPVVLETFATCPGNYRREIHAHLRQLEREGAVHHNYMALQRDVTPQMRSILIDWLVEVAQEYHLAGETLHLCVHYTDRFLSRTPVQRSRLQLVGVTCMLLACKFEEVNPLAVDEFVYISDGAYSKEEVLRMESLVLGKLDFSLSAGTSKAFLKGYEEVAPLGVAPLDAPHVSLGVPRLDEQRYHCLSSYLIELALQETDCLRWLPSMVAASAICLARVTLGVRPYWTPQLQALSAYDASAVRACIVELHSLHRKATSATLRAVFDKYATPDLLAVSGLTPPETLPLVLDTSA